MRAFNEQGARVTFADINRGAGSALVEELGGAPRFAHIDLTDTSALQQAISDADKASTLTVLINNAANDMRHRAEETSPQAWRECMAINLDAAFFAAQACAPILARHGGGSIINFSSINALLGPSNMPGYVSAKAGLIGMTKALAKDYGDLFVRVSHFARLGRNRTAVTNLAHAGGRVALDGASGLAETADARGRSSFGIVFGSQ